MTAPIVMLDMDGVLADWTAGVMGLACRIAEREGLPQRPTPKQMTSFKLLDSFDLEELDLVMRAMRDPHLYQSLSPLPGAKAAVDGLRSAGVHVGVLSSPDLDNPTCASAKLAWLERHFDRDLASHAVLAKDKTLVHCDLLVDDKPEITGFHKPAWQQVLFDHPYNRHVDLPRLSSWEQWTTLLPLLEGQC